MTTLIDNGSTTSGAHTWQGGEGLFVVVAGTWNGATISLQRKAINGTWVDVGSDAILVADGMASFSVPGGDIRAEVVGTPSNVYATVTENQSRTR